jgi:hypothetical protein
MIFKAEREIKPRQKASLFSRQLTVRCVGTAGSFDRRCGRTPSDNCDDSAVRYLAAAFACGRPGLRLPGDEGERVFEKV